MSNDDQVQEHLAVGGNGISLLPPGMTQEEADRLVREADERQARIDAGMEE
jgi:hypothetical protein